MAGEAILGISPGTRVMGIAIIRKGELIDWRVKSFKEKWSRDKRVAILSTIAKLCTYYSIDTVVLKKTNPLHGSPQLERLITAITRQAKRQKRKVITCSLEQLDYDTPSRKKTRKTLSESVAQRHPELKQEYIKERNNRKEYYTKMFEAVAIAEQYTD